MTIVLIGPSGAGKGTQADRITSQFDWLHISTGDLFRECLEKRTALGLLGQRYMSRGELVPDEVVDAMIEEWLLQIRPEKDILFDGFPRTRHQAEFLDTLLQKNRPAAQGRHLPEGLRRRNSQARPRPPYLPHLPNSLPHQIQTPCPRRRVRYLPGAAVPPRRRHLRSDSHPFKSFASGYRPAG